MRAVVYTEYGPADVLHVAEVEKPAPAEDEILIRVHAAEVTKADCEMRSFNFQVKWFWLPLRIALGLVKPKRPILGGYFAGEIEAVGRNVDRYSKGAAIFGCTRLRLGAYGEYLCLPARYTLAPKPENISFEHAAAVPLGGLNALHFINKANIRPGEKVLVNGAGGSIGTFGVQIAKAMGAEVTAVDSAIKKDMLCRIGADHFIDYRHEDFTENSRAYDVIFSMVANTSYSGCMNALKSGGRYLIANPRLVDMFRSVLTSMFTDRAAIFAFAGETQDELLVLKEKIEAGEISATIDKVYPFEQAAEAHHRVETEERLGTVVISAEEKERIHSGQ
ncbi:MAG: NAD(P)-dependent alcohol dehydrogenase [Gammaproteobacteria bacterium]|nr:NAD(P)-dependent alcohol dehydrogenase [Gammaproteobacteria bacterium]